MSTIQQVKGLAIFECFDMCQAYREVQKELAAGRAQRAEARVQRAEIAAAGYASHIFIWFIYLFAHINLDGIVALGPVT